jgi:hypothetical protein
MDSNFLATLSDRDVYQATRDALAALRAAPPTTNTIEYAALMREVESKLSVTAGAATFWSQHQGGLHERSPGRVVEYADNQKLLSALWRLIVEGLVFPRFTDDPHGGHYRTLIKRISITPYGERVLAGGHLHPRHERFVAEFRASTPTTTDRIVAYLEDASACLAHGLLRPALVIVGVANEDTVRAAHGAMAHGHLFATRPASAKMRVLLSDVLSAIPLWKAASGRSSDTDEQRHRLRAAAAFSETLRVDRNNVAHPGATAPLEVVVEGHLVGFARHANVYWESVVRDARATGFSL